MIVGNSNAGKKLATLAIAIVLVTILITAVIALRKPSPPTKEPPLHPSTIWDRLLLLTRESRETIIDSNWERPSTTEQGLWLRQRALASGRSLMPSPVH